MSENQKAGTESALNKLHEKVSEVMYEQVKVKEPKITYDMDGEEVKSDEEFFSASPALLAVAAKFLKDNQITCDVSQDENMSNLKDVLEKKQKHSRLGSGSDKAKLQSVS